MINEQTEIAIIGAGASGMMAAIAAASLGRQVSLYEGTDKIGKKILATGNGKCNLTHLPTTDICFYGTGKSRVESFLAQFGTADTLNIFNNMGLLTRDRDGYVYPYSEQASAVLDILITQVHSLGIKIYSEYRLKNISPESEKISLFFDNGRSVLAQKVVFCTGGFAAPKTGSDGSVINLLKRMGVSVVNTVPALVKVKSDSQLCKLVDGVRAKGSAKLYIDNHPTDLSDQGEIQFTKDGLSGIPIFNLSREISYGLYEGKHKISVVLDLFPEYTTDELISFLSDTYKNTQSISMETLLSGIVNRKLAYALLKMYGYNPENTDINIKAIKKLSETLKGLFFNIIDVYGFEQAQVTAGGIDFKEINNNLEFVKFPGVYAAGELLDIDGKCGGYNLQWAWTSGYLAGKNAAHSIKL